MSTQAIRDAMAAGPIKYACHADNEVQPTCTFDPGQLLHDCIVASRLYKQGLCRTDCADWKPINVAKSTVEVKAEDLAALLKELDAAKADAERYRWLRDQDWFDGPMCVLCDPKRVLTKGIGIGADCPSRDRLDTAIDKARASLTPSIGEKG
jgi:hypothetical protein